MDCLKKIFLDDKSSSETHWEIIESISDNEDEKNAFEIAKTSCSLIVARTIANFECRALSPCCKPIKAVVRTLAAVAFLCCALLSVIEYIIRTVFAMICIPCVTIGIMRDEEDLFFDRLKTGARCSFRVGMDSVIYTFKNLNPKTTINRTTLSDLELILSL